MASLGWFRKFLARHVERCPRADWPDLRGEYWVTFEAMLAAHRVTEAEADAASRALAVGPPLFLGEVMHAFRAAVLASRPRPGPGPREEITAANPDDVAYDAACRAHWRTLTPAERQEALDLVVERMGSFMAQRPQFTEVMAMAWAYDPIQILRPPPAPAAPRRPYRRLFGG